ncbi:hypothetical protein P5673_030187, partial [Acropora cervicornis]
MLVDIQGSGFDLFDPEIASTDLQDEVNKQYPYCTGNLLKEKYNIQKVVLPQVANGTGIWK